jgi:hypothetical protein
VGARDREVDEDAQPEPEIHAMRAEAIALRAERAIVRERQHRVQRLFVRQLLEEQSGRRGIWVHVGRQEVHAPYLDRIQ